MSYAGKLDLKNKARELRKKGTSVRTIQKKLKVSKSSVSIWIRDIRLTDKQLKKLYLNKKTGGLKGSIIAAMNKIKKREKITKEIMNNAKKEIGKLNRRDRFLIGVALYFAEGNKADKSVSFTNSDPQAIQFMTKWLRDFCQVPEDKFRASLYIHDNLDEQKSKKYWSSLTKISEDQFGKSYIVKNNPKRFRKTINQNGVFRITVSDVNLHRRIMGWIAGILR
jgi:predicted transcriptional regulator